MKYSEEVNITICEECPFISGMGGGDVAPGFVKCELKGGVSLIPSEGNFCNRRYGAPPPSWCPLRKKSYKIVYKVI